MRRTTSIWLTVAAALAVSATALRTATDRWLRFRHPALRGGGAVVFLNDVLPPDASGNPWLVAGFVDTDGNREPSAWTSPDGVAWARTTMAPSASRERRDGPFLVARRGSLAVALGDRFDGALRPAAWFSSTSNTGRRSRRPRTRFLLSRDESRPSTRGRPSSSR